MLIRNTLLQTCLLLGTTLAWAPPGMSERVNEHVQGGVDEHVHGQDRNDLPTGHEAHHDHSDNIDVADLVLDTEHILDDLDIYTERDLEKMGVDEKVFTWFNTHDWDLDDHLDGLEMVKALSHEHNYHHPEEMALPEGDDLHDPAQHTEAAERMRFRRTVKIVDKMLEEEDSNKDGLISFPEFMSAYHARHLEGLKLRKVKDQ